MNERWLPVIGFEGIYEVSDEGRVRSLERAVCVGKIGAHTIRARVLVPHVAKTGHVLLSLGKYIRRYAHVLVLEAFVGPCPDGLECCHDDDVKTNNRLDNLSWGTRSKNIFDAIRNGCRKIGESAYNAKLSNSDIPLIRDLLAGGLSDLDVARRYNMAPASIRDIRIGKTWKHVP